MAPAFPVKTQEFQADVEGINTSFILSAYADRIMVVATQLGTFGTVLTARSSHQTPSVSSHSLFIFKIQISTLPKGNLDAREGCVCRSDALLEGKHTFTVDTVLGKRDEPALIVCARHIAVSIVQAGCSR